MITLTIHFRSGRSQTLRMPSMSLARSRYATERAFVIVGATLAVELHRDGKCLLACDRRHQAAA